MGLVPLAPGPEESCNPPGLVADAPLQALPPKTRVFPLAAACLNLNLSCCHTGTKGAGKEGGRGAVCAPGKPTVALMYRDKMC